MARFLGTLLADPLDVPWNLVDFLAVQLDVADHSVVKRYTSDRRPLTADAVREHHQLTSSITRVLLSFSNSTSKTPGIVAVKVNVAVPLAGTSIFLS
jgi:hypothetical protein